MAASNYLDPNIRDFNQLTQYFKKRLDTLESGLRQSQLKYSSIDDGALKLVADGRVQGSIGKQPDGTVAIVYQQGNPPPVASMPMVTPLMSGLGITWDGKFEDDAARPANFDHVEVHLSTVSDFSPDGSTLLGTMRHAGSWPATPLEPGTTYYARLLAVNTSGGTASAPSPQASGTPDAVVASGLLDGIVNTVNLADDAVTQAKVALAAIGADQLANNSVVAGKVAALAIIAGNLAADSVQAGNVAADVITGREIQALSIVSDLIAANAINSGHIQAGAITADKLAAALVIASQIIAGAADGARLQLDPSGITQFDVNNNLTLQMGADPAGGNFLTVPGRQVTTYRNLCINPKLDVDATGWSAFASGTTGARVAGTTVGTAWCYRATYATGTYPAGTYGGVQAAPIDVHPGETYTISFTVCPSAAFSVFINIDYDRSDGTWLTSVKTGFTSLAAGTATRMSFTFTVPAGAVKAYPFVLCSGWNVNDYIDVTQEMLLRADDADPNLPYFDGDSVDSQWDGTVGASTSTQTILSDNIQTLASLSSMGDLSAQSVSAEKIIFGGNQLTPEMLSQGGEMVARGKVANGGDSSASTTSETGWYQLGFMATAGRMYKLMSSPIVCRNTTNTNVGIRVHYTTDGSAPMTSSATLTTVTGARDTSQTIELLMTFPTTCEVRLLLTCVAFTPSGGGTTSASLQAPAGDQGVYLWVEDAGVDPGNSGATVSGGGGGSTSIKQTYTSTWQCAWMQGFNQHGVRTDGTAAQGYYNDGYNGDNTIMIGFDDASMRSMLAGATINWIQVYLYSWHWYYDTGGVACLGAHNVSAKPTSYSVVWYGMKEQHMNKPQGLWINVPVTLGNGLRDGTYRGVVLDAIYKGHDLNYYGKFNWCSQNPHPAIKINYTK